MTIINSRVIRINLFKSINKIRNELKSKKKRTSSFMFKSIFILMKLSAENTMIMLLNTPWM